MGGAQRLVEKAKNLTIKTAEIQAVKQTASLHFLPFSLMGNENLSTVV